MLHVRFDSPASCLLLEAVPDGPPRLAWFGPPLGPAQAPRAPQLSPRGSMPDAPVPASLFPTAGLGWCGPLALEGTDLSGRLLVPAWQAADTVRDSAGVRVRLAAGCGMAVALDLDWDADAGVLTGRTRLTAGPQGLRLARLAALCLPLPDWARELLVFDGRWIAEGHPTRLAAPPGAWERLNRTGRTGFAGSSLVIGEPGFTERTGRCLLLHLAWSGSHRLRVETTPDRQSFVLLEPLLEPGEIELAPGDSFETPAVLAAFASDGIDRASRALHAHARACILPATPGLVAGTPVRPVHFNTWEAVYFDFDCDRLVGLAGQAAALGCERFVLDDGWFKGRGSDRAGLGDWTVDPVRFPQGLAPLTDALERLGLEFGLWVEPEMVNPDSDLARAHPDWILGAGGPQPTMRHQLVLDLTAPGVTGHLFAALDRLLRDHPVRYLKWDFNRDLFPPTAGGRAASHRRVTALYGLLDRLRAAHPDVQIETCSSGGARLDLGILSRTHRVWPSDNTDPQSRLRILRWQSLAAPLECLGSHVGPAPNPSTGRSHPMGLRCALALFGWMGVEADPGQLDEEDRTILTRAIALARQLRPALAAPELVRLPGRGLMQVGDGVALAMVDVAAADTLPQLPGDWEFVRIGPDMTVPAPARPLTGGGLASGVPDREPDRDGLALLLLRSVP